MPNSSRTRTGTSVRINTSSAAHFKKPLIQSPVKLSGFAPSARLDKGEGVKDNRTLSPGGGVNSAAVSVGCVGVTRYCTSGKRLPMSEFCSSRNGHFWKPWAGACRRAVSQSYCGVNNCVNRVNRRRLAVTRKAMGQAFWHVDCKAESPRKTVLSRSETDGVGDQAVVEEQANVRRKHSGGMDLLNVITGQLSSGHWIRPDQVRAWMR